MYFLFEFWSKSTSGNVYFQFLDKFSGSSDQKLFDLMAMSNTLLAIGKLGHLNNLLFVFLWAFMDSKERQWPVLSSHETS